MLYFITSIDRNAQASLAEVLVSATGADVPPTLGFTTMPTIAFTDEAFLTANTCATILRLPTALQSYEDFKEKIDFSILNSLALARHDTCL